MENVTQIVQKVRQAHWRVQRQWIGLFLLGLVAVSMVAGIYLNVTVRATLAGREIQLLQSTFITDQRTNSDLETQLAGLTSIGSMQQRAEAMGFQPASTGRHHLHCRTRIFAQDSRGYVPFGAARSGSTTGTHSPA